MIPRRRARTDRPTEPEALRLRFPGRRVEGRHDGAALMAEKCLGLLTGGYSVTGAPISDFRETACPRDGETSRPLGGWLDLLETRELAILRRP